MLPGSKQKFTLNVGSIMVCKLAVSKLAICTGAVALRRPLEVLADGRAVALQVLLLSLLFTGYLVNIAAVTPVLQWVHYLSVFFFGFESLIVNEMSGINLLFAVRCRPFPRPPPRFALQRALHVCRPAAPSRMGTLDLCRVCKSGEIHC